MEIYTIPLESFKQQFGNMMQLKWKTVKVKNPQGFISTYETFPIEKIKVLNDQGQTVMLQVKPTLEMRVTDTFGKKTTFYFDKIKVENDILIGGQSRYLTTLKKEIPLSNIAKIQIQDGKKKYKYVE